MIPPNIQREHIIKAIRKIDLNGTPPGRESRRFLLIFGGSDVHQNTCCLWPVSSPTEKGSTHQGLVVVKKRQFFEEAGF